MSAIEEKSTPPPPAAPPKAAIVKLVVMFVVMYLSRKLDGEDKQTIFILRCLYGTVQLSIIVGVAFIINKVQSISTSPWMQGCVVYVPMPVPPFPPPAPDAKKQYKQSTLSKTLISTAFSLLKSSGTGILITVGLHLYKGMIVGLAMQSVMAPFNLYDSKLVMAVLKNQFGDFSLQSWKKLRLFEEKYEGELTIQDEIVDENGNLIIFKEVKVEDVLQDVWDDGENANVWRLMGMLNKSNINCVTEKGWTPIMIMAALNMKNSSDYLAMVELKKMGADPTITDDDGENALHWAAYHGSRKGVQFLMKEYAGKGLEDVKNKEGKLPLDHAKSHAKTEKNEDIVKLMEQMMRKTQ